MPLGNPLWCPAPPGGRKTPCLEPRPTLCGDCDQQYVTDIQQAWPGTTHQGPEQDQEQTLPEQKAGGTWLSRFRR
ncbi:hypothetical protein GCM10010253_67430 [Streptomyces badius]|uniref:Oxidoreductase n=1 Tax=Streptomyces badius TaxID=1941 RepID=A0ABQ2TRN2_STRBA|nr:hypothetical protein GCM10010253_67430 [Streptomyces badius]